MNLTSAGQTQKISLHSKPALNYTNTSTVKTLFITPSQKGLTPFGTPCTQ